MNKLTVSIFAVFLFLAVALSAQTSVYLGPKGGVSFFRGSWIGVHDRDINQNLYTTGYNVGATLQIRIRRIFYIQPEVNLTRRGLRMFFPNITPTEHYEYKYGINTAYIMAKFGFAFTVKDFKGSIFVGPAIGIGIAGKITETWTEISTGRADVSEEPCGICFSNDYSAVLGVGMSYELGPGAIVLNAQTVPTLSGWFNETTGSELIAQNAIDLSIGYLFRLTKRRDKKTKEPVMQSVE